jgi:hypothetical protein
MQILDDLSITTTDCRYALAMCSGENSFNPSDVNKENWVQIRNKFLADVSYNGARSHTAIINVLLWFNQFND